MDFFLGDMLFGALGWAYLYFRYRNKEKMIQIKDKEYNGHYSNVGRVVSLKLFLVSFILLLIGFLVTAIIGTVRNI